MKTKIGTRKIWEVGKENPSLVANLPKVWTKSNNLDKDSKIEVEMNEKGYLIIKPKKESGNSGKSKS